MLHYVEDVDGMAGYAWAEAVWQVLVETMEDTQRKLANGLLSEVQLNGFCLLIQMCRGQIESVMCVYVISVLYPREHEMQHSVVQQFMATDAYGYYVDDGEGWLSGDEPLRRAREAYTSKIEMQQLEEQLMELKSRLTTYEKKEAQDEEVGRVEEELQTAGQSSVKGSCIGVPGNNCGGKLVGDMVGSGIPKQTHDGEEDAVYEFTPEVCSEEGRRRASNIVTQMKFKPRLWKASVACTSPYTNPLHQSKGPKRARRCLTVGKKAIRGTTEKVGMIPTVGDIIQNDATTDCRDECGI
ncbi:hypothetical protein Cgig2_006944 [Carnegiea gigantea]|uniref:Uncharacterized protein n=1 Tax=Carnegiea gigantea TaxID=171969 RepID=A0A9Q1KDT4_9CARY|nr:hypothetical protein Cgig2_006944 [Carnegiea gigantea]